MDEDELNLIEAMAGVGQALQALRRLQNRHRAGGLVRRADDLAYDITAAWQETRPQRLRYEPPADYPREKHQEA